MTPAEALARIREETEQLRPRRMQSAWSKEAVALAESRLALAEALAEAAEALRALGMGYRNEALRAERALRRAAGEEA